MTAWNDYPDGYGMPALTGTGWPTFAERWYGGEYPAGRGQQAEPPAGWQCPGCTRCYGPAVVQCRFCGPAEDSSGTRDLTWAPDSGEPDES